jgi:hypothetical protein
MKEYNLCKLSLVGEAYSGSSFLYNVDLLIDLWIESSKAIEDSLIYLKGNHLRIVKVTSTTIKV